MNILAACATGAALAADACAVSIVCGASSDGKYRKAAAAALCFGTFQALMPAAGWSIGRLGNNMIHGYEGIAALVILCFLGVKMMLDSFKPPEAVRDPRISDLLLLSVATSIDAMTAGIALPTVVGAYSPAGLLLSCCIIGGITAALSFLGYIAGSRVSGHFPTAARIIGGTALVFLGIKALF